MDSFRVWVRVRIQDPESAQKILGQQKDLEQAGTGVTDVEIYTKSQDSQIFVVYTFDSEGSYKTSDKNGLWDKARAIFRRFDGAAFETQEQTVVPDGWAKIT